MDESSRAAVSLPLASSAILLSARKWLLAKRLLNDQICSGRIYCGWSYAWGIGAGCSDGAVALAVSEVARCSPKGLALPPLERWLEMRTPALVALD